MANRDCRRCKERGQTWAGDAPECAFTKTFFSPDNWNCATMNALRDLTDGRDFWESDEHAALLPIPHAGEFLIMRWYKNRGRVDVAAVLNDQREFEAFSIRVAEHILDRVGGLDDHGYWMTPEEAKKEIRERAERFSRSQ